MAALDFDTDIPQNADPTAALSPDVAAMRNAQRMRAAQEAMMQRQNTQNDLAAERERKLQGQNDLVDQTRVMANDLGQWSQSSSTPQYQVAWDKTPDEVKQHVQSAFPNIASAAPKIWNDAVTANTGVVTGVPVSPASPVQKMQAAKMGIAIDPYDTADDLMAKVTARQQEQASDKDQASKEKNDIATWRTLVRGNPTSQTIAKNLSTAERNLQSIRENLSGEPDPVKDNNAITAIMGIEKPGVSPTDSDRKAVTDTAGALDRLKLTASNLFSNNALKLTPKQRAQMRVDANLSVEPYRQQYRQYAASQIQEAINRGLDPNKVIAPGVYDPKTGAINVPQDPKVILGESYEAAGQQVAPTAQPGIVVSNQDDYGKVPKGAQFTWNGKTYTKQ